MDFITWFQGWLIRHPLKTLTDEERQSSTESVMARVRAITPHQHRLPVRMRLSWGWPRLAIAVATIAIVVGVLRTTQQTRRQLAQQPHTNAPSRPATSSAGSPQATDDEWVDQTLKLLEQLDEDAAPDTSTESEDESWLKELELLDEHGLSGAS